MLTSVLRDSLGGNCKTIMVANLSSEIDNEDETISTARFALRCSQLVNEIRVNQRVDANVLVSKLEAENQYLRQTVEKHEELIRHQQY